MYSNLKAFRARKILPLAAKRLSKPKVAFIKIFKTFPRIPGKIPSPMIKPRVIITE